MKKINLSREKIVMSITIGIACFALSCVTFMQFKIVNETDITSIETMREGELRTELANWKSKYEEADKQYQELEAKVEEYKQKRESNNETSELVMEELEEANMKLGKTNIEGQGIEITIKPSQSEEIAAITADDLINIVNSLKSAGAEAISINDERILTMTDIVDINELFIKVNGQRILSPYVIKAVGNKSYLESALIGAGGVADNLKKLGHEVTIIQSDKVLVKKYDGDITYKYIND